MRSRNRKTAASDNRSIYLANMSHEIRTPMNAIVGLSDLLLKQVKNPEEREYLYEMQTATKNLLMTINNILDYEGMVNGSIRINSNSFEVGALLSEVISITKLNISDKNVKFLVDADPGIPGVLRGDVTRIKQVLVHLLSNAEKFTKQGYIKLKVSYANCEAVCNVTFLIEDTGNGMKPETVRRVFLPYEQADASTKRDEGGLGIGLTIANALVNLMGGKLKVESEIGKGTKVFFTLALPIVSSESQNVVRASREKHVAVFLQDKQEIAIVSSNFASMGISHICLDNLGELFLEQGKRKFTHILVDYNKFVQLRDVKEITELGATFIVAIDYVKQEQPGYKAVYLRKPFWHGEIIRAFNASALDISRKNELKETICVNGARVLLVDDNDINLRVTAGLLRPYGVAVDTASSGEEGIRLINKTKYDIVYMDHMMPGMDGVEVTKIIREIDDPYYRQLPIIALSANAIDGAEEMFINAGMNAFLAKPVEIEELEASLIKWLPADKIKTAVCEAVPIEGEKNEFGSFKKIDVNVGLSYTNGDVEIYRGILKDFAMSLHDKQALINKLANDEDIGRFTIEVHSLKSVSKTIGAVTLSEKALELERLGHARDISAVGNKLNSLNFEIECLMEDLKPFAGKEDISIKRVPLNREKALEKLKAVYDAADDFDYETARDAIVSLGEYLYPEYVEALYQKMHESIENIDYDETRKKAVEIMAVI